MVALLRPELAGKSVGFIIKTARGKYTPTIAKTVYLEDDADSIFSVTHQQPPQATLAEARAHFDETTRAELAHVFEYPIPVDMMGIWQSVLESAEADKLEI